MKKTILLGAAIVVLVITIAGVALASSYKTTLTITSLNAPLIDGKYTLEVKVIMNYGPFGGSQPLNDGIVQVYGQDGTFYRNFTMSNGVTTFYLPPGTYTVYVASLHYTFTIDLSQSRLATLSYAYLVS